MLTFEQKKAVIESFPELERKDVSLGRVNYQFEESKHDKKNVVYHLHPNGNGFVYAGLIRGYKTDDKGFVNIRDFTEDALRKLIRSSIQTLSEPPRTEAEEAIIGEGQEERWFGPDDQTLILLNEDEWWNIYAGLNLEESFGSYEEAIQYLEEEGFTRN